MAAGDREWSVLMDIEDLYALIPDIICTPGCIACCNNFGVPSRTAVEDERMQVYFRQHNLRFLEAKGNACPYVTARGCSIYPVRPLICRLYGTSPSYRCQMNIMPLNPLHEDEEAEILFLYQKYFF